MFIWNEDKNQKLIEDRGVSFNVFENLIMDKKYIAILKNPIRETQKLFIIPYNGYTYVVPFVIDDDDNFVLKTIFPSRKYHKLYGGSK